MPRVGACRGPLDRAALAARVDGIIATYTAEFFAARRRLGLGNDQPVFIVGLPRSGTTLTEQILSAHPLLHGAGELPDLARLAARLTRPMRRAVAGGGTARREPQPRVRALYLRALRDGAPEAALAHQRQVAAQLLPAGLRRACCSPTRA